MRNWLLLSFGAAFLASAWAANHGGEDFGAGYRYGVERANERCKAPSPMLVSAFAICGHNQRPPDADPAIIEYIQGCVEGYSKAYASCSNRIAQNDRRDKPVTATPATGPSSAPSSNAAGAR